MKEFQSRRENSIENYHIEESGNKAYYDEYIDYSNLPIGNIKKKINIYLIQINSLLKLLVIKRL